MVLANQIAGFQIRHIFRRTKWWGHLHLKLVQRQLLHLGFCWWYRHIMFGYKARIFHFSFFNVSHNSLNFKTWNLIEYLHTYDFQRATAHLNIWTNILLFHFMYGCKQHTKISQLNQRGNLLSCFALPHTLNPFWLS